MAGSIRRSSATNFTIRQVVLKKDFLRVDMVLS